jgi:hypothetical protein
MTTSATVLWEVRWEIPFQPPNTSLDEHQLALRIVMRLVERGIARNPRAGAMPLPPRRVEVRFLIEARDMLEAYERGADAIGAAVFESGYEWDGDFRAEIALLEGSGPHGHVRFVDSP